MWGRDRALQGCTRDKAVPLSLPARSSPRRPRRWPDGCMGRVDAQADNERLGGRC